MVGERQRVCGAPSCQKERHRRACARFHDRDPDYDRHTRFTAKLVQVGAGGKGTVPAEAIDWRYARKVVGLEISALVEESGKVLLRQARDAVLVQLK
ncbi:hypothetical protein [Mesoterricola sediminis]|nr:hypothetical protein [Mesoterricola sediminis]